MITRSVDIIKSKPGIYLATSATITAFIEVTGGGIIHQLKPDTFERDGVLRDGYWNTLAIKGFYGPLVRPNVEPDWKSLALRLLGAMQRGVRIEQDAGHRWIFADSEADYYRPQVDPRANPNLQAKQYGSFMTALDNIDRQIAPETLRELGENLNIHEDYSTLFGKGDVE
jgi:hypothetical protein